MTSLKAEEREPEKRVWQARKLTEIEINCKTLIIAQIMSVKFHSLSLGLTLMTSMFYSSKIQKQSQVFYFLIPE